MIFINDAKIFAKVWDIDAKEKYTDVRISTSEKDQEGNYLNSNWFARAIGHAHNSFKKINKEDRITITRAKLTNETYTDKEGNKRSAFKFLILEVQRNGQDEKKSNSESVEPDDNEGDDGDLPW